MPLTWKLDLAPHSQLFSAHKETSWVIMEIFITSAQAVRITEEIRVIGHLKYGLRGKFYRPPDPVQVPRQDFLYVVQDSRI